MNNLPDIVGRFHPLLVHLPIGFLVLLAVVELLAFRPRFQNIAQSRGVIITLAALAAVASAACGWFLSSTGNYDQELVAWHQRLGIAVAVAAVLTAILHGFNARRLYRGALTCTLGLLVAASHFGGSLTHGSDFLTAPFLPKPAPITDPRHAQLYAQLVQPILAQHCYGCHGSAKQLANLRVDSRDAILAGNKDGRLLKHMRLPLEHPKHMPPAGKPQPSAPQIALVEWWLAAGAPAEKTVAELPPNRAALRALESLYGPAEPPLQPQPLDQVQPLADKLSAELNIIILPIAAGQPWLQCNASLVPKFGDAELARLAPLAANMRWLDLGGTRITAAGLAHLARMRNLTRLHLERTAVNDSGLAALASLRQLEYLNLYGTAVTDAGLGHLSGLPALRKVYLWQTVVTNDAAVALHRQLCDDTAIQSLQTEIDSLQSQIAGLRVEVNAGAPVLASAAPPKPINENCPVSGKPVDPSKTVLHDGKLIGFCCDKCIAAFNKNPQACLVKLGLK